MLKVVVFAAAFLATGCASQGAARVPAMRGAVAPLSVTSGRVVSQELRDVEKLLAERPGVRTLLVLDIDDTLLTSSTFFGSDAWYEWQRGLTEAEPGFVPCRFDVIAINYEVGTQKVTQSDGPDVINPILPGQDTIILTSRSSGARAATLRELRRARYSLPRPLPGAEGSLYRYPRDGSGRVTTISYDEGVFMTQGQNKGLVLLDLLDELKLKYDRIVLVDDGDANHTNMEKALASRGIEYRGLHYTRVDKEADAAEQSEAAAAWGAWGALIEKIYPERMQRMRAGQCAY